MRQGLRFLVGLGLAVVLAGCATAPKVVQPEFRPAEVRARIVRLLPAQTRDREGWAVDIQAAFAALEITPNNENLCAALAVTEQESTFTADPAVPDLARIARREIDRRATSHHIPSFAVSAALHLKSANGKRYDERLASIRTERELSLIYEGLIASVPLGKRLFADANPVRTGGPMQVSISFAEQHADNQGYPYPIEESIRREVFSRRGGMYFGITHLLGYPVNYPRMIFRFADFNAGLYASRNAAFQKAVSLATGIPLAYDGDLILHEHGRDDSGIGTTERAVRSLSRQLDISDSSIRRDLERGDREDFDDTRLYRLVFELAEKTERHALPRATIPQIDLDSPKITRKLTTEWFAKRVDDRNQRCLRKAAAMR
ncbi:MAG: DUF1615 domain-containing protein [Xanthomonadales bacterium]|nr:DUF1615 domain-containing protein [Xanthomonadales bacterium]